MAEQKNLRKIKSSVLSRSLSLARLGVSTSARLTGLAASTLLSSSEEKEKKWQSFLRERSGQVSRDLGELKGSLMKAGQMLSMYGEHFLPPEANQLLKSLQAQSPPLAWPEIEKVLKKELGPEKLKELEIEKTPIGSASLGQVHSARVIKTGDEIALKIQYPGVEKAIDSDLKALKSILSLLKILPKNFKSEHLFKEVKSMLEQETDYHQEARETELYSQRLVGDSRFIVPKIYSEYSTRHILATSLERGLSPDDPLVRSLSQERRNRLAFSFLELYLKELFQWGVVQTDPHLGNYRIRLSPDGQDQIVLLDFGATRNYADDFLIPYRQMVKASLYGDKKSLHRAALKLKFIRPDDPPELLALFEEFCLASVEPFRGLYDWKNSDLPRRLPKIVIQMIQKFEVRSPPQELIFLDRKTGGVFIFCGVMKAVIDSRDLILKYSEEVALA